MQTVADFDLYNHPEFLAVLHQTADCARAKMPDAEARILRASMLVMNGHVHRDTLIPQAWIVDSESQKGVAYQVIDNVCTCESYTRHQSSDTTYACKHILAIWLYRRVAQRLTALPTRDCWQPVDADATPCQAAGETCAHHVTDAELLAPYVVQIHGRPFVKYAGLLYLAHQRGLMKLEARLASVTDTVALAEATATFADGRVFSEAADATPKNTSAQVAMHFPRCALTRAKSRALKDALGITMVALEELDAE